MDLPLSVTRIVEAPGRMRILCGVSKPVIVRKCLPALQVEHLKSTVVFGSKQQPAACLVDGEVVEVTAVSGQCDCAFEAKRRQDFVPQ